MCMYVLRCFVFVYYMRYSSQCAGEQGMGKKKTPSGNTGHRVIVGVSWNVYDVESG